MQRGEIVEEQEILPAPEGVWRAAASASTAACVSTAKALLSRPYR